MAQQVNLRKVFVGRLFDRFDYSIDFTENGRDKSGITIITAPNGYGKSTLLRLVDDLMGGRYAQLSRTTFSQLVIEASDGSGVMVERRVVKDDLENEQPILRITQVLTKKRAKSAAKTPWDIKITPLVDSDLDDDYGAHTPPYMQMERIIERELGYRRISAREWQDPNDGRVYGRDELARLFEEHQAGGLVHRKSEPSWLTEFRSAISVLYIPANRLRTAIRSSGPRRPRGGEMVEVISDRVMDQIRRFNGRYAFMGRSQEQQFPSKVIDALNAGQVVQHSEVMSLMEEVRNQEAEYQSLGLLSEGQTRRVSLGINDKSALLVLGIYLKDIKSKLQSLRETAERLKIFIETLNSMLLFKRLKLTQDIGFQVVGDNGQIIPLRALSSGEQHLIVLLGEIIFESVESRVVLLDEPEISFHPEWQELFPKVLEQVVMLNQCMIVMATHSPTLIQDKWDSVVELADQVEK